MMEADAQYNAIISNELYRFRTNEGKNERAKKYMQNKRSLKGAAARIAAPLPINTTKQLFTSAENVTDYLAPPEIDVNEYRRRVEQEFMKEYNEDRPDLEDGEPETNTDYLAEEE